MVITEVVLLLNSKSTIYEPVPVETANAARLLGHIRQAVDASCLLPSRLVSRNQTHVALLCNHDMSTILSSLGAAESPMSVTSLSKVLLVMLIYNPQRRTSRGDRGSSTTTYR